MSSAWKFGGVRYLNGRPLIFDLPGELELATPAELTARFARGDFDAALLSFYDVLAMREVAIVPGAAIGCRGPVYSVVLAYRGELADLRRVALDPSSRTSSSLLQILMREFFRRPVEYAPQPESPEQARLIIGDPAIAFRQTAGPEWRFLDLGEAWEQFTGLPFVFAVWVVRRDHPDRAALTEAIQRSLRRGRENLEAIAAQAPDPEFAKTYLTKHIRYEFGEEQRLAAERFRQLIRQDVKSGIPPRCPRASGRAGSASSDSPAAR